MSDASAYGPSAIATPANFVTVTRLLVSPLLFAMIANNEPSWVVFWLWVALASTDGIDGFIARRQGTTRSGAFLDPLADKVLVLGALCSLAAIGRFSWIPVLIIGARELASLASDLVRALREDGDASTIQHLAAAGAAEAQSSTHGAAVTIASRSKSPWGTSTTTASVVRAACSSACGSCSTTSTPSGNCSRGTWGSATVTRAPSDSSPATIARVGVSRASEVSAL